MGLTKRTDSYYVEFRVLNDGKVLTLAPNTPGAKHTRSQLLHSSTMLDGSPAGRFTALTFWIPLTL